MLSKRLISFHWQHIMEIFKWQTWVLSGYWWKTEYKSLLLVPDSTMTLRKLRNWEKHKGSERSWETHKGSTGEGGGIKRKDRMFSFFLFFSSVPFYFILFFSLAVYFKRSFLCLYITNGSFLMYVCNIYPSVQRACKHFPFVGLFLCICSFILFWWFFFLHTRTVWETRAAFFCDRKFMSVSKNTILW